MAQEVPSSEQIERLAALQGVDPGIFTLAVFSVIEAYMRDMLGDEVNNETSFSDLVYAFRGKFPKPNWQVSSLFADIRTTHFSTNDVRHKFKNLSVEEATGAVFLLDEFARIFNIPNGNAIKQLTKTLEIWKSRTSPAETARELEKALEEIDKLSRATSDMSGKVSELEKKKDELGVAAARLRTLQADYDIQIEKNRRNQEKIDELRKKKYEDEQTVRQAQKQIKEQIAKLSDAEAYISNLSRMTSYTRTRYDYEKSLLHLTNEQKGILERVDFRHDFLVKGAAGTGKSLVLLKMLEKLIRQNEQSLFDEQKEIKLITFSRSLEKYNRYIASLMQIADPASEGIITTSDSFIMRIIRDSCPGKQFDYGVQIPSDIPEVRDNPLRAEIKAELTNLILPRCISRKEYCEERIRRTGMKDQQGEANRVKIWNAVEAIFSRWDSLATIPVQYASYLTALKIKDGEYTVPENCKVDFLFIDEAQDITSSNLFIMKAAAREHLLLAGDNDQSVFQPGFTWARSGIDVTGSYTRTLSINFRSTNQINDVAEKYHERIKGGDKEHHTETFRLGPPVELHENSNAEETYAEMVNSVKMCINSLGYAPENICLIATRNDILKKLKDRLKDELNLESQLVSDKAFEFAEPDVVRLATVQSCKGLDFPVVLCYLDHRSHFLDSYEAETADKMNRNMVYTAITRSIEMLHVFMLKNCSEGPLGDLKEILSATYT